MQSSGSRFGSLQTRLLTTFGLLVTALSFVSALAFLNVERAMLETRRERDARSRALFLLVRPVHPTADEIRLAGFSALVWRAPGALGWAGASSGPWQISRPNDTRVSFEPRWYGRLPKRMEISGVLGELAWRAEVDLSAEADILERSAAVFVYYLFLNVLVVLLVGAVWLTRAVARPLRNLAQTMADIRSGVSAFKPITVARRDEIGVLVKSFNNLMDRVQDAERKNLKSVSDLEAAYLKLEAAQEQMITSEKLASLGRMSAGLAHEIGNPLAAISGYLQLLGTGEGDPERMEIVSRARAEAGRIDRIIRGLLAFSRPQAGRGEAVPAGEFVAGVIAFLRTQALFKDIVLELDGDGIPALIPSANGLLEQVVVNLCINAADAMDGKGTIHLSVAGEGAAGGWVRIDVADTGCGIAHEDLARIFEPFFTTKPSNKGTGLGLAISHQIITALGGEITARSSPGQGACFSIRLRTAATGET